MNVNQVRQLISIKNDVGKLNYAKNPSNYPKGSTNLENRILNDIVNVIDSEDDNSDSTNFDGVRETSMDDSSGDSTNSLHISDQKGFNT